VYSHCTPRVPKAHVQGLLPEQVYTQQKLVLPGSERPRTEK
jgi:hypothetical protein